MSPHGSILIADNTVRLWDGETGKPLGELTGHSDPVLSAAFSPDGKRIVTASADSTARLWKIFASTDQLVMHAKATVPRCLTEARLASFFLLPEPPAWCIEMEKWPYHTAAWKHWLRETRAGKTPPLPPTP
jgi:WD domain, G-beta repeat